MANLILQALQNSSAGTVPSPQSNPMSLVQAIRTAQNPNLMLQQLARTNPNVASAMSLVQRYGGDPQKAFYEEAKKKGIDPNQILGMLR